MAIKLLLPALSPTMVTATIAKWTVSEGDIIEAGQVIAEIEADKAVMEFEAVDAGIMHKIVVKEGSKNVEIGSCIAIIRDEDESEESANLLLSELSTNSENTTSEDTTSEDINSEDTMKKNANIEKNINNCTNNSNNQSLNNNISLNNQSLNNRSESKRISASPLARRIAQQNNIKIENIENGSGPYGRIIKNDVLNAMKNAENNRSFIINNGENNIRNNIINNNSNSNTNNNYTNNISNNANNIPNSEIVEISSMRRMIANRLTESKQNIPHFYLSVECEVSKLVDFRKTLNEGGKTLNEGGKINENKSSENKLNIKISFNDLVVKAIGKAASMVPEANYIWNDENIIKYTDGVDIAIAIAIPNGLITPIIRKVDQKSISTISSEIKQMVERAKSSRIRSDELVGGAITISNLGMYNVNQFNAIINPPHSSIFAIGGIIQKPIVKNGDLSIGNCMNITISCDHRVIDGAVAAIFLNEVKELLENPIMLLV